MSPKVIGKRVQSPSSINTYKQCPRKYYYQYIQRLPTKTSIHLLRGSITHEVLEKFFDTNVDAITKENYLEGLTLAIKGLFLSCWNAQHGALASLGLPPDELDYYREETVVMLANWLNNFVAKAQDRFARDPSKDFQQIWKDMRPASIEEEFQSKELMVRGFVDYIEHEGDEIRIMDFKTSSTAKVTPEYKLQLAIYALLYHEKHKRLPNKVGLWFLKHGEILLDVNDDLLELARFEIEQIHMGTQSISIVDYPKRVTPLCRYSTGECDFYGICFGKKVQA